MFRLLLLLAAVLGLLCASPAVAQTPESRPSKGDLQALMAATDEIAKTVSELRGLPVKKPIARGIMSREDITKRLRLRIDEDFPGEELIAEEAALKRLGMIPAALDYKEELIKLLTEQIVGFYDPQVKELYLADWIGVAEQRMVMAHEIDHALQDQSFDLVKFTKPVRDNGDEELARQALVEGDGFAVMIEFMLREQKLKMDPWANDQIANMVGSAAAISGMGEFDKAPLMFKESLLFPYQAGLKFVAVARRTRPWGDIDGMFRSPPQSTEQIMHPEKYRAGEKPVAISTPALGTLKGWKRTYNNVIGEMMMGVFLRQHGVDKARAERAAAGWGGDSLNVFAAKDGPLLALDFSAWDAEMDASEAFDALGEAALELAGAKAFDERSATFAACTGADGGVSFVERKGTQVVIAVGVPKDMAAKLRADVWSKWKAGR